MVLPIWIGRAAAILLLMAVIGSAYLFVVPPILANYSDNKAAIADARGLLGRYQHLAAARPELEAQIAQLEQGRGAQGTYLTGSTDALAAAELQNRVKGIIDANGGKLRSIQSVAGKADGDFQPVTIRVQLVAPIAALQSTLYQLESTKPYLFLGNVDVSARRARRRTRNAPAETADPQLTVRFDLYGYREPEVE
jgi:general secretion pathway protein M